jgi:hypothetical protein
MAIAMTVPSGFSATAVINLNDATNTSTPVLKACSVIFQSAGENVGSSNPQCTDPGLSRFTYTSSVNSTVYDQLSYDYGVISNLGPRSTTYASTVNTIVYVKLFIDDLFSLSLLF